MIKIYILLLLLPYSIQAQGYCSLRNPQAKIRAFYPDCNGYKTIVRTIDNSARVYLGEVLPFSIHHYEIGRHNLYTVNDIKTTKGLVHARTEQSQWGLIEIVWSLNTDLTVKDFDFQRCRTQLKTEVLKDDFKRQIVGKHFYELRQLLDETGYINSLVKTKDSVKPLAKTVIHSALKTIALTEFCWKQDLEKLRFQSMQKFTAKTDMDDLKNIKVSSPKIEAVYKGVPLKAVVFENKVDKLFLPINKSLLGTNIRELKNKILEASK